MAQVISPEKRAKQDYMLAKVYARLGNDDLCLECLKRAKSEGYGDLDTVYKEEEFSKLWRDPGSEKSSSADSQVKHGASAVALGSVARPLAVRLR